MGIGTSLGAYFETQLDHHAGNEYLINPNNTPDNNELSTNEVMPQPDEEPKVIPVSDIKTASPLVTITDEDIDKAMNLGMSFSGGGLTTGKVLPMRKAANDNAPVYNPREPNMIGSKAMDDHVDKTWKAYGDYQKKVNEMEGLLQKGNLSEFESRRVQKLHKEAQELYDLHSSLLNE